MFREFATFAKTQTPSTHTASHNCLQLHVLADLMPWWAPGTLIMHADTWRLNIHKHANLFKYFKFFYYLPVAKSVLTILKHAKLITKNDELDAYEIFGMCLPYVHVLCLSWLLFSITNQKYDSRINFSYITTWTLNKDTHNNFSLKKNS